MSRRRIDQIVTRMGTIVGEMQTLHFRFVQQERRGWEPLMNVYRYPDHYEICVELAGVVPADIQVSASGRRVAISGVRLDSRDPLLRHKTTRRDIYERAREVLDGLDVGDVGQQGDGPPVQGLQGKQGDFRIGGASGLAVK